MIHLLRGCPKTAAFWPVHDLLHNSWIVVFLHLSLQGDQFYLLSVVLDAYVDGTFPLNIQHSKGNQNARRSVLAQQLLLKELHLSYMLQVSPLHLGRSWPWIHDTSISKLLQVDLESLGVS